MQQIMSSPVPQHVRRNPLSCQRTTALDSAPGKTRDHRWHLLDLVRKCRDPLGLRDRDITVLRGLLSLVPASAEPDRLVVFASNRVLTERCDGIDERTLRRRILHLQTTGLLTRKQSPNGKRYQVRDEDANERLTYGIDLSPLFQISTHLESLAETTRREELRKSAHRSVLRDMLYHHADSIGPELREQARLSLRRSMCSAQLEELIAAMKEATETVTAQNCIVATELTGSGSQNDRHIHRSEKESHESEAIRTDSTCSEPKAPPALKTETPRQDITVEECCELATCSAEMATRRPTSWADLIELASVLAPAIGISKPAVQAARVHLGAHGCALAIIGLVEAFGRIRKPQAYLHSLTKQAQGHGFDAVRMFRSLVRPQPSRYGAV